MYTLSETDAHFKELGATHYHDDYLPDRFSFGKLAEKGKHFSRHYFKGILEIGYVLPEFLHIEGMSNGTHYFDSPRKWGMTFPPKLMEL